MLFKYSLHISLLIILVLLISCNTKTEEKQSVNNPDLSKLDSLFLLNTDTFIAYYDLSNEGIKELANLSEYKIRSLNLSENSLSELPFELLPKEMEILNLSNNNFSGLFIIPCNTKTNLKEINLSYNQLDSVSIDIPLRKIILSHNDLTYLTFSHSAIKYLDISYNPRMSNIVYFSPEIIDTVIHNNISNNKPLVFWLYEYKMK